MCKQCIDIIKELYPDLPVNGYTDFLMALTCYPFGSVDQVESQLRGVKASTDGTIKAAYEYVDQEIKKEMEVIQNMRSQKKERKAMK